jgi:hypothetical protein
MPLWVLTIVICTSLWVAATALVAVGAVYVLRHEPH